MRKIILFLVYWSTVSVIFAGDFSVYEAGYPGIRDRNVHVYNVKDEIRLCGTYFEHTLTLTVSYDFNSWFFKNYEELEFQWTFQLPEEATVFDFQFWFQDSLVQALILDRWTAEFLFNEVSSPFREPAILTRGAADWNGNVSYSLRVFPIKRNEPQQFIIRYLVPVRPTAGSFRTWLPVQPVTGTLSGADSLRVEVKKDPEIGIPKLIARNEMPFQEIVEDSVYVLDLDIAANEFYELVVPVADFGSVQLVTFADSVRTYYQLIVDPPRVLMPYHPRNLLILIDYAIPNTTGLDAGMLFSSLKETLVRSLTEEDSISVIAAFTEVVRASDHWTPVNQETVDSLFVRLSGYELIQFNSSQELFAEAIDFLNQQKSPGEIVWITNRIDLPTSTGGGQAYAQEIVDHFPPNTVFHILNLDNVSPLQRFSDFGYMVQTFPFLSALTRETGGNLFFLRFHPLKTIFEALFFEKVPHYKEIEVQVQLAGGYVFDKQLFSLFRGYYPMDFPVIQTGLMEGELPATVTVIGRTYSDSMIIQTYDVPRETVKSGPPQVATAWYGHHLQEMAHKSQSSWVINDMIDLSIESRVLTQYTAFLVPNPEAEEYYREQTTQQSSRENQPDNPPVVGITGNGRVPDHLFVLRAYPNPFNPQTTISIQVPRELRLQEGQLLIFNVLGQVVKSFTLFVPQNGSLQVIWDARDESGMLVPSGSYFAVFRVKGQLQRLKLLYIR